MANAYGNDASLSDSGVGTPVEGFLRHSFGRADQLYIHRTTFCRRMEQIQKLTGLSQISGELALDLLLSLKLLERDKGEAGEA